MTKKTTILSFLLLFFLCGMQAQTATLKIDATQRHQHITGFGGFVCSPQFQYGHMSASDIKKVWGEGSTVGCNIMRLYIPIGKNSWSQSLATARQAKNMGLIVFASPWGQPAEWKTNGTINAKNADGTTGSLKREHWADYAQYLEDYVQYLRQNGVELDAISIQNEPDWPAQYAGCLWSATEIAEFVKTYGRKISCRIIAPETLAVSDNYANALNAADVLPCFDIYGGHQYGGIQSAYKKLGQQGKELWMTEYLVNWNEIENNTRNFDFSKDFFNFFTAINQCMLGDFNAWVHYTAKRYYGMLGDGQRGTTTSVVTKRGYVMAHFARFVTGMTRVGGTFANCNLEGSCYLSAKGDTVVAVVANAGAEMVSLALDLPFYTVGGKLYTTSKTQNLATTTISTEAETCRPLVTLAAQSVATILFIRSRDRQPSQMKGATTRFDLLDNMAVTKSGFGANYKISGKQKKFDHANPLLSSRTNANYGYIELSNRFSELVMQVKNVSSTLNYTSAQTTLIYVNGRGEVATHDYGELDLNRRQNFSLVFDLSPRTLTDGCLGLIGITNNNWSSTLTINFGDVYLANSGVADYSARLSGSYVADDSFILDYTGDPTCTSIDLRLVTDLPTRLSWLQQTNRVVYVPEGTTMEGANIVAGGHCQRVELWPGGGDFHPAMPIFADAIEARFEVEGFRLVMLPFNAVIPQGARAYMLGEDLELQEMRSIPAHTPVLVEAQGEAVFTGQGDVGYAAMSLGSKLRGTYNSMPLYAGDYVLGRQGDEWGLVRLAEDSVLPPFGVYAQLPSQQSFVALDLTATAIVSVRPDAVNGQPIRYNLMGQRVSQRQRGIVVCKGRKTLQR